MIGLVPVRPAINSPKLALNKTIVSTCILLLSCLAVNVYAQQTTSSEQQQNKIIKAYEVGLFHYFQGDFFQALTQFEMLEQEYPDGLKQLPEHLAADKIEPELLIGGISLAYGLENQAADIFSRLLSAHNDPKTQTLAWMLLGKTYYQKRQFSLAAQAFAQISTEQAEDHLGTDNTDEWLYMQSQLHGFLPPIKQSIQMLQGDWLNELSEDSIYRDYVQYNQSLALLQQSRPFEAIQLLTDLANNQQGLFGHLLDDWLSPLKSNSDTEEYYALKDRANLTLGYTYLQQGQVREALQAFQNVRLQSLDSQAALLGYGWAAAKDNDYQIALSIWQRLKDLSDTSEYVLEAYLASAYAYERAFAPIQAIDALQQGLLRYQEELVKLNKAKIKVSDEAYIRAFAVTQGNKSDTENKPAEFGADQKDIKALADEDHYLRNITLSNEFRAKVEALSSSVTMQNQLRNWLRRMQYYYLMLEERQTERSQRGKLLLRNRLLEQLTDFGVLRDQLGGQIQLAKDEKDSSYLAPLESIAWQQRLDRANGRKQSIEVAKQQLNQKPLADKYQQRLERLQGILLWQASEAFEQRVWQAQKQLNQLDDEMKNTLGQQQRLLTLLAEKPEFNKQKQRIEDLELRITEQMQSNNLLQVALVNEIRAQFGQMLDEHIGKVNSYILQAQQAVVRLNDQALRKANNSGGISADLQGVSNEN
ncbi:MAG: hypothetical protein ACI88A_002630 [Paraglaciecola sp.]|jgi:hypothetical protein